MSLANISLVGNLVKAPEQLSFASGKMKSTFTVAVNRPHRSNANKGSTGEGADYYRVEAWGKLAELTGSYLQKGNQVTVIGRLTFDHWTDRQGMSRVTPLVEANQVAFPQRLKVVKDEETNPISGELVCGDDFDLAETGESLERNVRLNDESESVKPQTKLKSRTTA